MASKSDYITAILNGPATPLSNEGEERLAKKLKEHLCKQLNECKEFHHNVVRSTQGVLDEFILGAEYNVYLSNYDNVFKSFEVRCYDNNCTVKRELPVGLKLSNEEYYSAGCFSGPPAKTEHANEQIDFPSAQSDRRSDIFSLDIGCTNFRKEYKVDEDAERCFETEVDWDYFPPYLKICAPNWFSDDHLNVAIEKIQHAAFRSGMLIKKLFGIDEPPFDYMEVFINTSLDQYCRSCGGFNNGPQIVIKSLCASKGRNFGECVAISSLESIFAHEYAHYWSYPHPPENLPLFTEALASSIQNLFAETFLSSNFEASIASLQEPLEETKPVAEFALKPGEDTTVDVGGQLRSFKFTGCHDDHEPIYCTLYIEDYSLLLFYVKLNSDICSFNSETGLSACAETTASETVNFKIFEIEYPDGPHTNLITTNPTDGAFSNKYYLTRDGERVYKTGINHQPVRVDLKGVDFGAEDYAPAWLILQTLNYMLFLKNGFRLHMGYEPIVQYARDCAYMSCVSTCEAVPGLLGLDQAEVFNFYESLNFECKLGQSFDPPCDHDPWAKD